MESSDDIEDLLSWEVIPSPFVQQQSVSSAPLRGEDLSLLVKENFCDESAAFPPSEHEGLEVSKEEECFETHTPSSFTACPESEDGDMNQVPEPDSWLDVTVHMGKQLRLGISDLSSRIVSATSYFWPCAACRAKTWTLNSVTAFMAAMALTLAYARMNRWHKQAMEETRHALLIYLRQQEQKISLLLLQVAHMNEMLSARRRVPVILTC